MLFDLQFNYRLLLWHFSLHWQRNSQNKKRYDNEGDGWFEFFESYLNEFRILYVENFFKTIKVNNYLLCSKILEKFIIQKIL